jgi:metal-dependent amidase/aminoacylase/carboxypeptidase family protein
MARKPTDYVQFKLRIRESLRRKIERAAEKAAHSANAEAVRRIEHTFEEEEHWEQMHKQLEEDREQIDEQQRQYYEEQAREKAEHEAALRDSRVLNTLVGRDENAQLLRLMILGMGNNPEWAATSESRKIFADKVHHFLLSHEFNEGGDPE